MNIEIGFNAKLAADDLVAWLKEYGEIAGMRKVIVGNSGGKDCAVVMAACVKAFGVENVLSLMMPNGQQKDIQAAYDLVDFLGIENKVLNIWEDYLHMIQQHESLTGRPISEPARINIAPKIRMTYLTTIGQDLGYRPANTSNASELYVGYCTKWGDMCGDFRPLINYTCNEVILMGLALGLPEKIVLKKPEDGLTGKTDEENLRVTYDAIHGVIRHCYDELNPEEVERIQKLHNAAQHKVLAGIPSFPFSSKYYA